MKPASKENTIASIPNRIGQNSLEEVRFNCDNITVNMRKKIAIIDRIYLNFISYSPLKNFSC